MDGGVSAAVITLLFSGDVTLGFHYEEYINEQLSHDAGREEMSGWGFKNVRAVTSAADLFVVNLECPFTTRGEKLAKNFNFRANPSLVAALESGGVDVVSLANNHMMDYGPQGLSDTLATLDAAKIVHFGAGVDLKAARAPAIVTVKGVRFAFLGYFFLSDRNIEPPEVIATATTPGVAGHHDSLEQMKTWLHEDIAAAKRHADVVIPFFHWGIEGHTQPEPYQVALGHLAIDSGASAVIGSHPHVLQGVETYKGAPIAYSLGNFVFGGNWNPLDKRTALVKLTFKGPSHAGVDLVPAFSDDYPKVPVQPYLAAGDGGVDVLAHIREISKSLR